MRSCIALLGLAALMAGCAGPTVVGKYRGEVGSSANSGNLAQNLESGLASSVSLEIKSDRTFHMVATIVPIDGKWTLAGDKLTLTPDRVFGFQKGDGATISSDKPMEFRVTGNGLEPLSSNSRFRFVRDAGAKGSDVDIP